MKLHELITQYVAFEKALGKCFRSNEYQLKSLNYFLGENIDMCSPLDAAETNFPVGPQFGD